MYGASLLKRLHLHITQLLGLASLDGDVLNRLAAKLVQVKSLEDSVQLPTDYLSDVREPVEELRFEDEKVGWMSQASEKAVRSANPDSPNADDSTVDDEK